MEALFVVLSDAMAGAPALALAAAFVWGVLSVVLSPCHLASIPLIVGFLQRAEHVSPRRVALLSSVFAVGILGSIALIGGITAAAGRMLGDLGPWGNYAVAGVLLVFGLHLLDLVSLPEGWRPAPHLPGRGPVGALLFGLLFGVALGPCTFGFMAPVLGVVFSAASTAPLFAAGVVGFFALGHCMVIAAAGVSSHRVQRWLRWQDDHPGAVWLRRGCGMLVVAGGVWLVYSAH